MTNNMKKNTDYFYPSEEFKAQANLNDSTIFERFTLDKFPDYYAEFAELIEWKKPWQQVFDAGNAPHWQWYLGGTLNASHNCIDRHLPHFADKTAISFVPEPESEEMVHLSYGELHEKVNAAAAMLRENGGIRRGDRVAIHLPMCAELPITMLACARLGAVHTVIFGGFSASACADRIINSQAKIFITIDGYYRSGRFLDHKAVGDEACTLAGEAGHKVEKIFFWQRFPGKTAENAAVNAGDVIINEELKNYIGTLVEPEEMDANDPLFLMYTSGTTGKPKGAQHGTGGYLSYVTAMSKYILDIHPEDVYWCMADIGWITGHSFIVYGPLSLGASVVIYEGVPTFPDAGRSWRIAEELNITIFHTAPTVIRVLRKLGPEEPARYNFNFRHMTTVGEPIEPDVWLWYKEEIGKNKAVVCDTYWQTETGGFLCATVPALLPMKPGSAGPGVPGIHPAVIDEEGQIISPGSGQRGSLCIRNPWPGCMQTIWGDDERFVKEYYGMYSDTASKNWQDWLYLTGDAAVMGEDGYIRILGRIDDVINVSGHRIGSKEIESAAMTVPEVAEAAVVSVSNEIKGAEPEIYISLRPGCGGDENKEKIAGAVEQAIIRDIGKIAKCRRIWVVADMPKTRSGKIMRRVLASISNGDEVGNVMTLANPEIVDEIKKIVQ
ncbi:MAG: acetate--CoA ligase [Deltaproteobacteria bacterium]|nr:MAG: acetate--CoA ligase [Deltaproteobacteria bacterium]